MFKQLRTTFAELGAANFAWYLVARLLRVAGAGMWRYHFVAQPIAAAPMRGRPGSLAIRPMQALADLPASYPRPRNVVAARLRQGGCSIAAWHGDQLAGFLWYQFGAYQEDEVRARYCLASPRSCWDYDVYVDPALRLGTAFCRLWDEANRRLRERGIRWTCSRISAFNPGSLRAHRRFGIVDLGSANFFRAGRWQLMLATIPPYVHLSSRPGCYPRLVFDTGSLEQGAMRCTPP